MYLKEIIISVYTQLAVILFAQLLIYTELTVTLIDNVISTVCNDGKFKSKVSV